MNFPDMSETIAEWGEGSTFQKIEKITQDHQVVERRTGAAFDGLFYPMSPQEVKVKPEGQRTWRWWTLVTPETLETDYVVVDASGIQYRVTEKEDWGSAGFYKYGLTEAYRV